MQGKVYTLEKKANNLFVIQVDGKTKDFYKEIKEADSAFDALEKFSKGGETMKNDTKAELVPVKSDAEALIAQAIDKNVSVETMERLLAMRRELKAEFAKEQFDKAMARFQAKCPVIQKKETAGAGGYTYKYAPLDHIVMLVRDLLSDNGFSYTFDSKKTDHSLITFCHVKHVDGHSETSQFEINIDTGARMNISQKDGAASSYGKRYAFCNAFGILTGDEDTDVSSNKQPLTIKEMADKKEEIEEFPVRQLKEERMITEYQINDIREKIATLNVRESSLNYSVKRDYKVSTFLDLTSNQAVEVQTKLAKQIKEMAGKKKE